LTQDPQVFEKFGEWIMGTGKATTQAQNKLGYRDRLVAVDAEMTWAQIVECDGGPEIVVTGGYKKSGLRYPFVTINHFRSLTKVYRDGADYVLTPQGTIRWIGSPPASGTRLSLHGTIHPVWIVMDHLNAYRDSLAEGGAGVASQKRQELPVQAMVKLDFLIDP